MLTVHMSNNDNKNQQHNINSEKKNKNKKSCLLEVFHIIVNGSDAAEFDTNIKDPVDPEAEEESGTKEEVTSQQRTKQTLRHMSLKGVW